MYLHNELKIKMERELCVGGPHLNLPESTEKLITGGVPLHILSRSSAGLNEQDGISSTVHQGVKSSTPVNEQRQRCSLVKST